MKVSDVLMSVLTKNELMEKVKNFLGDDTSDEALEIIEDISDTVEAGNSEDWKQKYEENDKKWREKYRDRFFNGDNNDDTDNEKPKETENKESEKEQEKLLTFENLFKGE